VPLLYLCVWLDDLATQMSAIPTSVVQACIEAQELAWSVWEA